MCISCYIYDINKTQFRCRWKLQHSFMLFFYICNINSTCIRYKIERRPTIRKYINGELLWLAAYVLRVFYWYYTLLIVFVLWYMYVTCISLGWADSENWVSTENRVFGTVIHCSFLNVRFVATYNVNNRELLT